MYKFYWYTYGYIIFVSHVDTTQGTMVDDLGTKMERHNNYTPCLENKDQRGKKV